MDNRDALRRLISTRTPCIFIPTFEEAYVVDILSEIVGDIEDCAYFCWTANQGLHTAWFDPVKPDPKTEHPAAAMFALLDRAASKRHVTLLIDLVEHLGDARTLRLLRDVIRFHEGRGGTVVLVDHRSDLPPVIHAHATCFEPALPDEKEVLQIVRATLRRVHDRTPIRARMSKAEMSTLVKNLSGLSRRHVTRIVTECALTDRSFTAADMNHVLAAKRRAMNADGLLEYVESPISLDEIGGLRRLKRWLKHRVLAQGDEAVAFGLTPPRGVLLLGVQGAGKSLSAKAIAAAWGRPLLRMDPGALYDRYIGESERRLRGALRQAEMMAPVVLWIDEIEKGFASAAGQSTDGGVSQRMFGTLLTWMQDHTTAVFLVATANNIDALPPELLRKGRFDEIFFVDLPSAEARRQIFRIHLRQRGRDPDDFDLVRLATAADGYSGAEIEQGIVSALHEAFTGKRDIDTDGVETAIAESPPLSVTMAERLGALRAWAQNRCVPAD